MMSSNRNVLLIFLLATACCLGISASAEAADVTIGTGAAGMENIIKKIEHPLKKRKVKLKIVDTGSVQGLKDVDAGKIECVIGGWSFDDWMAAMKKDGYAIPDPSVYQHWVIGQDTVKVLTHTDVSVKSLSQEQLLGIFTGRIDNWSQVGGPDKPIIVVLGTEMPGTLGMFQKIVMGGAEFTRTAMTGTTAEDVKSRVIINSGAIGIGTATQVDRLVNAPAIPEISRPITLLTRGEPTEGCQKIIDFILMDKGSQSYTGK
ncbi:substrate-binding domain-containing protein [Desulfosarcina sp. OttesenSCG-928-G10]|nr:substrate-binding domain-containing protein [Desulfosarcina sp. OttesenSCG-928-G10]